MTRAIIIGVPNPNTLGLIRSLGSVGINPDVFLVSPTKSFGCIKSKYINNIFFFDNEQDIIDQLISDKGQSDDKPILFASSDHASATIDSHYEELKDYYVFFNASGNIHNLMNKETMCQIAKEVGLNVPDHIVYHKGEQIPTDVSYPCITKAISSIDGDKSDTTICQNKSELVNFLSKPDLCKTIQIEEFIEKAFEFQFIGLSLDEGNKIIIPGHSHIDRPNGIQNVSCLKYVPNDLSFEGTLKLTKNFIQKTKYSGLFSVEFLRAKDGLDYFLEMNFRNDYNALCVTAAGYNLPAMWYSCHNNENYKYDEQSIAFKPVNFCPEFLYTLQCAYCEIPVHAYLKNMFKTNCFATYYKGDSPWYWTKFSWFAFKQVIIKRLLIRVGILKSPKESV